MHSQEIIQRVASQLLAQKDLQLESCKVLQSLWAGYGHISHVTAARKTSALSSSEYHQVQLQKSAVVSLILKYVTPPATKKNKSKKSIDEGHIRKVLSYQIEQYFYTHLAPLMPASIGIATCMASIDSTTTNFNGDNDGTTAMLLTDLRIQYPIAGEKRGELNHTQTYAALEWLARFHGFWWKQKIDRSTLCRPPLERWAETNSTTLQCRGVWLNGGYTYLATRRKEYASLVADRSSEWSRALCTPTQLGGASIAELAAQLLSPAAAGTSLIAEYETLLHGDVKSENLFLSNDGRSVAFFDFQYVGLGLGVCDLAKLFTCSVPMDMLVDDEDQLPDSGELRMHAKETKLLQHYCQILSEEAGKDYDWEIFIRHWETALVDWLRFQASWGFWGNTDWLEARVRSILRDDGGWKEWVCRQFQ